MKVNNVLFIIFMFIGLDLTITWNGKEVFNLCWGLHHLLKGLIK